MKSIVYFMIFFSSLLYANTLNIAFQSTKGTYHLSMNKIIKDFKKKYPNTKIKLHFLDGTKHKKEFNNMLENSKFDIITWQGGQRLFDYEKKLEPINDIWTKHFFDTKFEKKIKRNIMKNGNIYALPISYYQWGFYYNKKVFNRYKIHPPKTWKEMIEVSKILRQKEIIPFIIGAKNGWTSAGWFDYLNLRINGLDFHKKVLKGEISYKDEKLKKVFIKLKELIDNNFFINNAHKYTWLEPMPYLYRQKAGMTFIGNFFSALVPKKIKDDIGFFSFPLVDIKDKYYENAPLDLFVISKNSQNKNLAKEFLLFFSKDENMDLFNKEMGTISPSIYSKVPDENFLKEGLELLKNADGLSLFFDLDTKKEFSTKALKVFTNFFEKADIKKATNDLEKLRKEHYGKKI